MNIRHSMKRVAATSATAAAALALAGTLATAAAQDKITFATNWVAQAEHGGWYQALANSYYKDAGLDVTIRMGDPSVNTAQLLAGGAVDIAVGGNDLMLLNFVEGNITMVAIAATYQKDPQCFIAHPGRFDSIAAMTDAEIQISADARATFWQFLKAEHGLSDNQVRPYNFDIRPFLVNQDVVQQCYATSSPHTARDGGIDPDVFMFSDYGWSSYSAILMAARQLVDDSPEIVQRFVDASAKGWYSYLYEDPAPGNALITAANPDMTQENIDRGLASLRDFGIVDSGEALDMGIGAMSDARWQSFFDVAIKAGLYASDLDFKQAYTLQFVNNKAGMDLKQ